MENVRLCRLIFTCERLKKRKADIVFCFILLDVETHFKKSVVILCSSSLQTLTHGFNFVGVFQIINMGQK